MHSIFILLQDEYFDRHPGGVNPVLLNDVVFSVNAAVSQAVLILQCFILKVHCVHDHVL